MDGCSGFSPDHLAVPIRNIRLVCGLQRPGNLRPRRNRSSRHSKKLQQPQRTAAADFPQQKITGSVLADPCVFPHLSSSPDLRINSSTQPSQVSPMTGFRLHAEPPRLQWRYRPGFPPGYLFSRGAVTAPQALKRNIYLRGQYTRLLGKSQSKKEKAYIETDNSFPGCS